MIALHHAAFVLSHHLAQAGSSQDGLTQAALAFRELAVTHHRPPPEDLFRRLADWGQPFVRFGSHFAFDSAAESLWRLSRLIRGSLVEAITDGLASRAAEANRVTLGVVHPSEFALVQGKALGVVRGLGGHGARRARPRQATRSVTAAGR